MSYPILCLFGDDLTALAIGDRKYVFTPGEQSEPKPPTNPDKTPGKSGGSSSSGSTSVTASISPKTVDFDTDGGTDITVTLNSGSYRLSTVKNGEYTLVQDTDYTVSGNKITFKADYLRTLEAGTHTIVFDMSGGTDPTIAIIIKDATQVSESEPKPKPETEPEPEIWVNPFEDVKESDWFFASVASVYQNGLMNETSTTPMLFSPNAPITRGVIVSSLYNLAGKPDTGGLLNPFNDAAADGKYSADAIIWASMTMRIAPVTPKKR